MADDMLKQKWGMTFLLMDLNHDGIISIKDKDDCKASYQSVFKPEGKQLEDMLSHLDQLWDTSIFLLDTPDWSKTFTNDDFIESRKKNYEADKDGMIKAVKSSVEHMCKAAVTNDNNSFTYDELVKLHNAFNIQNEVFIKGIYNAANPDGTGKCTLDNVVGVYTELIVGEDKAAFEMSKSLFSAAGYL